jgi:hypothetical protein
VGRGERPIKLGDSWFSPKTIEVVPGRVSGGGRALKGRGGFTAYQLLSNSECRLDYSWRQWTRDNVRSREGKNPDRRLRPPSTGSVRNDVDVHRQLGGWLRSSHSLKECVIAHQSSASARIMVGTQARRRSHGFETSFQAVGERSASDEASLERFWWSGQK